MINNQTKIKLTNRNKVLILGGVGMLAIGGVLAYFTDTETKNNKFTVGNVDIQLREDKWDAHLDVNNNEIPDIAEKITPLKSIDKDPLISNVGTNDAWVYLEVKIPLLKNVVVADTDGNKLPAGDVELFSFTPNSQWTQLGVKELDDIGENMVYVYGYNTSLKNGQSTPTLFDTIKFANIIQKQSLETLEKSVIVTAKAIQTDGTGTMQEAYNKHFKRGQVAGDQYQEFELILNTNGATLPVDFKTVYEKGSIVQLPELTKEGYKFKGWVLDNGGSADEPIEITGDLTAYAEFAPLYYNIIYNTNGGNSLPNNIYTIEDEIQSLPTPTKSGYKFLGWYTNPEYIGETITSIKKGTTQDIKLYAKYRALEEISFKTERVMGTRTYSAMEDMTWNEWFNTEYTSDWYSYGDHVADSADIYMLYYDKSKTKLVRPEDTIIKDYLYYRGLSPNTSVN